MGIEVMGKHGNGNAVLEWEWVGMGMIRWEWERNGNKKVIPAHLYHIWITIITIFNPHENENSTTLLPKKTTWAVLQLKTIVQQNLNKTRQRNEDVMKQHSPQS